MTSLSLWERGDLLQRKMLHCVQAMMTCGQIIWTLSNDDDLWQNDIALRANIAFGKREA
jgi:hypothetical protein